MFKRKCWTVIPVGSNVPSFCIHLPGPSVQWGCNWKHTKSWHSEGAIYELFLVHNTKWPWHVSAARSGCWSEEILTFIYYMCESSTFWSLNKRANKHIHKKKDIYKTSFILKTRVQYSENGCKYTKQKQIHTLKIQIEEYFSADPRKAKAICFFAF